MDYEVIRELGMISAMPLNANLGKLFNNSDNNNQIYIVPHGCNFRGAVTTQYQLVVVVSHVGGWGGNRGPRGK